MIEGNESIEDMVNGEDDVKIMDGEDPFLLCFEPLRFFKCAAERTMTILAGFEVKLPLLSFGIGTKF